MGVNGTWFLTGEGDPGVPQFHLESLEGRVQPVGRLMRLLQFGQPARGVHVAKHVRRDPHPGPPRRRPARHIPGHHPHYEAEVGRVMTISLPG